MVYLSTCAPIRAYLKLRNLKKNAHRDWANKNGVFCIRFLFQKV